MKALVIFLLLTSTLVFAQEKKDNLEPLSFQAWKDQQVLAAQNQVLRMSAHLSLLKSGKAVPISPNLKQPTKLPSDKIKITQTEAVDAAESDLKQAQDSLTTARDLQFLDYVDVYVPTLQGHPEALQKLSDQLSKEELSQIFRELMRKSSTIDAKHNEALLDELTLSSRTKAP